MHFQILDTEAAYRRMLAAPDAAARATILRDQLAAPFAGLARTMGGDDAVASFAHWGMTPEMFAPERHAEMQSRLDGLSAANAWQRAAQALEKGKAAFARYAKRIPLDTVVFGLLLADIPDMPGMGGYTGLGGIPGWIMTVYGRPNAPNLARIEACTVHELHHNVLGAAFPGSPMIANVGAYIVGEGLAESFAAKLYGEELIGPWVTEFDAALVDDARRMIGDALDKTGFDVVRQYIFGNEQAGVPPYAGYAIGYQVVQAYLRRTGQSVVDATFVPAHRIIAESRFFA
ncbi:MAG: DUF2268 domain-containing protein [Chloroflexales bacterium]|nr:DUF2268 domain-containing protein [Chloroflexales bacterium]